MGARVQIRSDYSSDDLRRLARRSKDADQSRRLLALAAVAEGRLQGEAARIGGMDRQTLRDWMYRFNAEGPEGLINRKAPGKTPKLNEEQKARLADLVENGPIPSVHGVGRWRCKDLVHWVWEEYRVKISEQTMSRLLKEFGFSRATARSKQ